MAVKGGRGRSTSTRPVQRGGGGGRSGDRGGTGGGRGGGHGNGSGHGSGSAKWRGEGGGVRGGGGVKGKGMKPKVYKGRGMSTAKREEEEIARLEARIAFGAPLRGSNPLALDPGTQKEGSEKGAKIEEGRPGKVSAGGRAGADAGGGGAGDEEEVRRPYAGCKLFKDMPLCERTQRGLRESGFVTMTAIQRASLPHALCGRDILGAAKTGSGKTLAFLLPVLEKLHRMRWTHADGVGAIIISPTRELATQIFGELKKVGRRHELSGGLIIGGRSDSVESEKQRVGLLNVLVATPGRLLQHMDETPNFDCTNLQVLVLDEADRILDLGFSTALNAILQNLPRQRQTLLFSATQTKSVRDLARLSLRDPEYVAVHAEARAATPARLQQTVMVVRLDKKVDVLWSFLKSHANAKMLVFLSSCKQVKFLYEAFRRLRPGVPLKALHGRMKQMTRLAVFYDFCEAKHAALFATDVAARGLDFPSVDWVVQVDCPDDVATYIHRVGRTARYNAAGRSLLMLAPSESAMLPLLEAAKIPFKLTKPNPTKVLHIGPAMAGLLSKDPDLKYVGQRAFVTYLRSIHLQSNKDVFDVTKMPVEEYAASLGLPNPPVIRFLKKKKKKPEEGGEKGGGEAKKPVREGSAGGGKGSDLTQWQGKKVVFGENDGEEGKDSDKERDMEEDGEREHGGASEVEAKEVDGEEPSQDDGEEEEAGLQSQSRNAKPVAAKSKSKLDRLFSRKNKSVLSEEYERLRTHSDNDDDGDGDGGGDSGEGDSDSAASDSDGEGSGARGKGRRSGAGERGKGERDEEDDELLVVRRVHHRLEGDGGDDDEEERGDEAREGDDAAGDRGLGHDSRAASEVAALPALKLSRKKLKKLGGKPGKMAGTRVVFDDDGVAMPPLAALAKDKGGDADHGRALSTVSAAEERFRQLREEMRLRDREDRAAEKQRLREMRLKKKKKAAAAAAGVDGGPVAVLASAGGGEGKEGWRSDEDGSGSGGSGNERGPKEQEFSDKGDHRLHGVSWGSNPEGFVASDDDDAVKRMASNNDDDDIVMNTRGWERSSGGGKKRRRGDEWSDDEDADYKKFAAKRGATDTDDEGAGGGVAVDEALVLKLLAARRR